MLCWKTVTLAGNFTVNLRDTLNQTLPEEEEEEEEELSHVWFDGIWTSCLHREWWSDFSGYLRSFVAQLSCFLGPAVKVLSLSHVKTRQTLRSAADPLLLPHAAPPLFDFPRNFRGILLPIPNKKPAGKLRQLLVSANRAECYQQQILQMFK